MGRSTEQSYKTIVNYLQQRKLPATVNDMIEANISSRGTLYKLLRPEMFANAALFGIKPLNDTKPFFFMYDPEIQMQMLTTVDKDTAAVVKNHKDVLIGAANKVAANSINLDDIERKVIESLRKHRSAPDMAEKDQTLRDNFTRLSNAEHTLNQIDMPEVREIFLSDISKYRTFLISAYVASFNED